MGQPGNSPLIWKSMDLKVLFNLWARCGAAWRLARASLLLLVALAAGCNRNDSRSEPEVGAAPRFSLETFPRSDRMRLAVLRCNFLPRMSLPILSPSAGQLHLYVDKPQTNLQAD